MIAFTTISACGRGRTSKLGEVYMESWIRLKSSLIPLQSGVPPRHELNSDTCWGKWRTATKTHAMHRQMNNWSNHVVFPSKWEVTSVTDSERKRELKNDYSSICQSGHSGQSTLHRPSNISCYSRIPRVKDNTYHPSVENLFIRQIIHRKLCHL